MIKNERQLLITKSQLEKMKTSLKTSMQQKTGIDQKIHEAMIEGIKSQINDLEEEIKEYESLKRRGTVIIKNLAELPIALIKARITRNLTQEQLAAKLHLKPQQIQRYEQTDYKSVRFERLIEIGNVLGIKLEGKITASKK